jgi:Tol biopolymer transport system component
MKKNPLAIIFACLLVLITMLAARQFLTAAIAQTTSTTTLISVASNGEQANEASSFAAISANNRYAAFQSWATNLDPLDTSDNDDIYLRDLYAGLTTLASRAYDGSQTNGSSLAPALSANGRFVAFHSYSTNLVAGDNNSNCGFLQDENCPDVFVYDSQTGETLLVSIAADGTHGNGWSGNASISADGRYIAFESSATNLVANDKNEIIDIFVHDRDADGDGALDEPGAVNTILVSTSSDGTPANGHCEVSSISADGRTVAFASSADNLVEGDTNESQDIFVHDRDADHNGIYNETGQVRTARVSIASDGTEANGESYNPTISGDGRFVAFDSEADNLVISDTNKAQDVFLHDRDLDQDLAFDQSNALSTTRVSVSTSGEQATTWSESPTLSNNGRYVAFISPASNLDENCIFSARHIFLRDTHSDQTTCLSLSNQGAEASGDSWNPSISADGGFLAFGSDAEDLVEGDNNLARDIFLQDMGISIRRLFLPMVFDQ